MADTRDDAAVAREILTQHDLLPFTFPLLPTIAAALQAARQQEREALDVQLQDTQASEGEQRARADAAEARLADTPENVARVKRITQCDCPELTDHEARAVLAALRGDK